MAKFNFKAVAQDGSVHIRKTDRTYTHAVVGTWHDGRGYGVIAWCGREDLAQKQVAFWMKIGRFPKSTADGIWEVVPVEQVDNSVKGKSNMHLAYH